MKRRNQPKLYNLILLLCLVLFHPVSFAYDQENYSRMANLGISYIENKEYSKAIDVLEKAIQQIPTRGDIRNNLAAAYIRNAVELNNTKKDVDNALKMLRYSIYTLKYDAPSHAEYSHYSEKNLQYAKDSLEKLYSLQKIPHTTKDDFLILGNKLRIEGDLKGAIVEYAYALGKDINDQSLYLQLGTLYNVLKNYDRAIGAYEVMVAKFDGAKNKNILKELFKLSSNNNHYTKATDYAFRIIELDPADKEIESQILSMWGTVIAKSPEDNRLRFEYGNILQRLKRFNEALMQYNVLALREPENVENKINIGVVYQNLEKYQDAIDIYNQAINIDPSSPDAHYYKGLALLKQNKQQEAKLEFASVKKLKPDYPDIEKFLSTPQVLSEDKVNQPYTQALALHKQEKYTEAIASYQKAKSIEPANYEININLGLAYEGVKNYQLAINEYSTVIAHYPDLVLPYSMLGNAYKMVKNYPKAKENYDKALALEPHNLDTQKSLKDLKTIASRTYFQQGLELYEQKNYKNAKNVIQEGLTLDSNNPDGYYYLGLIADAEGNTTDALKYYLGAISKDNTYYTAYYAQAILYDQLGNLPKAKEFYEKFVLKAPKSEVELINYSKSRLKELNLAQ